MPDTKIRALAPTIRFLAAMYVASALGTNLGDLYAQFFDLGLVASFALTMIVSAFLILGDMKNGPKTEIYFWTAIIIFRAGATNVGDFITHDLHIGYLLASVVLAIATYAAGFFTRPSPAGSSPLIDLRYWVAMFTAGVFGTIFGDLVAHSAGLLAALLMLAVALAVVILIRQWLTAAVGMAGYWTIVLVERAAGTPLGDSIDSRHGLGMSLPVASAITAGLLLIALGLRWVTTPTDADRDSETAPTSA
jgi:uncharacterized membrane-anchored protein